MTVTKRFLIISAIFLLLIPALLPARGGKEKTKTVQVTGIVRLVGNEPFSEIVISNSDNIWYIPRDERYKLHDLQYQTVTVEGEETITELKFANGQSAGTRRELRNLRVITI